MCDQYNGWTNYPTWNIALWLDNEPGTVEMWEEEAEELRQEAEEVKPSYYTIDEYIKFTLADRIKEYTEEVNPLASEANTYSDLLGWVLASVYWVEIARHYMEVE